MNPLDSTTVANFFIGKSLEEGRTITPMQAIKLTYLAHGWHLGATGRPLVSEPVEAWQYGPVFRSLYSKLKGFGSSPVNNLLRRLDYVDEEFREVTPRIPDGDPRRVLLEKVWVAYSKFSGGRLSTLTHMEGTPWHETWEKRLGKLAKGEIIPNGLIMEHYRSKLRDNAAKRSRD